MVAWCKLGLAHLILKIYSLDNGLIFNNGEIRAGAKTHAGGDEKQKITEQGLKKVNVVLAMCSQYFDSVNIGIATLV